MSYTVYLQDGGLKKVEALKRTRGAVEIGGISSLEDVPEGKVLVVVKSNGGSDAAAVITTEKDFDEFLLDVTDPRPTTLLLITPARLPELA